MKAITFERFGGPEVLTVTDLPDPTPAPGEVLVRVAATTVNPTDVLMRTGAQAAIMEGLAPPYIAGMEFSGTIVDPNGHDLTEGTPVIGVLNPRTPKGGAAAQLIAVPAVSVAPLPEGVDLVAAATVPMNALTAELSLDLLDLAPASTLLVTGGAGMLGGLAIQLARARGLTVLANVRDMDADLVRSLGADHVLPREDFDLALRAIAPDGVDGMIDGALIGRQTSHLVRDGGGLVVLRSSYTVDDPRLRVHTVSVLKGLGDNAMLGRIAGMIDTGALRPRVSQVYPMTEAAAAHAATEAGGMRGRAVLDLSG